MPPSGPPVIKRVENSLSECDIYSKRTTANPLVEWLQRVGTALRRPIQAWSQRPRIFGSTINTVTEAPTMPSTAPSDIDANFLRTAPRSQRHRKARLTTDFSDNHVPKASRTQKMTNCVAKMRHFRIALQPRSRVRIRTKRPDSGLRSSTSFSTLSPTPKRKNS